MNIRFYKDYLNVWLIGAVLTMAHYFMELISGYSWSRAAGWYAVDHPNGLHFLFAIILIVLALVDGSLRKYYRKKR